MRTQARLSAAASAVALLTSTGAGAASFQSENGELWGSWDTTITYGAQWRVEDRDESIIATVNGGTALGANADDGNLNYGTGVVSRVLQVISELEVNYRNMGFFVRGRALYDYDIAHSETDRSPVPERAVDEAGERADILDAFAYVTFDLGEMPVEFRLGEQVVSWGESTFIQDGINVINHIEANALRVPGAELRTALMPQSMAWINIGLTANTSLEAFYQFDWDKTEPEAVGTFFSSNDFVPAGGDRVMLGFGRWSDLGTDWRPLGGQLIRDFNAVPRLEDDLPDDDGQFGLAFRWYVPDLGQGVELGFYFINYHSRLPLVSGRSGTQAGIGNGVGAATAVGAAAQALAAGLPFDAAVATAANAAVAQAAALGGNYTLEQARGAASVGANVALAGGDVSSIAGAFGFHEFGVTGGYTVEYPEDIKLYGVSFNTTIGTTGIAWQGDFTYREDVPLQVDDLELLFTTLAPFEGVLGTGAFAQFSQLGGAGLNQRVQGWRLHDTWQAQMTFTNVLGPLLGAAQGAIVLEAAYSHADLPAKDVLRYDGPGTFISGNAALAGAHFGEVEPQEAFADENSWGYRLAGRLDYFNAFGPWTLSPRFAWQHDVDGVSPRPSGQFLEDRKAITVGLNANLRNVWQLDLSYTSFSGAGRYNLVNDRDFVAFNVKASF